MTAKQAKILGLFCVKVAGLAAETLIEFAENGERSNQVSIATERPRAMRPERELLTQKQLAERLKVSPRTISSLQTEGLPVKKIKRRILFDYEEVLIWIDEAETADRRKTNLRVVK